MQGIIGVVGPTRMDYSSVAARLSYIADGISKMLKNASPEQQQRMQHQLQARQDIPTALLPHDFFDFK